MDIKNLISQKTLGYWDFGSVTLVRPTGRFIDAADTGHPDSFLERHRFAVEVKEGWFGPAKWVSACNLKIIKE